MSENFEITFSCNGISHNQMPFNDWIFRHHEDANRKSPLSMLRLVSLKVHKLVFIIFKAKLWFFCCRLFIFFLIKSFVTSLA